MRWVLVEHMMTRSLFLWSVLEIDASKPLSVPSVTSYVVLRWYALFVALVAGEAIASLMLALDDGLSNRRGDCAALSYEMAVTNIITPRTRV